MSARHVVIAIPAYSGQIHLATMRSVIADLLALTDAGNKVTIIDECGNAMIGDCRAMIVARFLDIPDATDLVFVDDDVVWPAGLISRMVAAPVDFIGAIYPQRRDPIKFAVRWASEHAELRSDPATGLLEVEGVPAGCMRVSRAAIERMIEAYPETKFLCSDAPNGILYDLFGPWRDGLVKLGEDLSFCMRWRAIGGRIWIDPEIRMGHVGFKTFVGSLGDWLRANNMPEPDHAPAIAALEQSTAAVENLFKEKAA